MNTNLNMQRMPIDRLKPAKYNPRKDLKPGDPAYEKIKRSLHDFGYVDPIVWNEVTGNIVGGHQRYKVLKAEGTTEVDCVVVHIENPQDEKALNIALNKATGDWEPTALADLLQDLQLSGYDLGATGFDAAEVDDLFSKVHDKETKEDDFDVEEELKQPAFSRKGDIWHLGRHVVLCGDSTLAESYEQLLAGTKVNMILSDLPYFVAYHGTAGTIQNDNLPDAEALEFTLKAMRCMYNALADDGSIYIFHADTKGLIFRKAFDEAGFYLSGCCIWKKNSLVLGRSPYQWMHEPCLFGWKKDGKHRWYSDRKQTTVWEYDRPKSSKEHPTMKPVGLMAYPIRNSTMTNGIVLDPFLGSGSTLIACDEMDRVCMGIEIDEKFVDVICKRSALSAQATAAANSARSIGTAISSGIASGISAGQPGVISAAVRVAQAAISAAKAALDIHSPSGVFREEVGLMAMKGMGEGFLEGQREQARIIRNAARYLTEEAQGGIVAGNTHNDNRQTFQQQSSVNLTGNSFYIRSDRDIHDLAVEIATLTRTQQRGRGLRMA